MLVGDLLVLIGDDEEVLEAELDQGAVELGGMSWPSSMITYGRDRSGRIAEASSMAAESPCQSSANACPPTTGTGAIVARRNRPLNQVIHGWALTAPPTSSRLASSSSWL